MSEATVVDDNVMLNWADGDVTRLHEESGCQHINIEIRDNYAFEFQVSASPSVIEISSFPNFMQG